MELLERLKAIMKRYYWVGIAVAVLTAALGVLILCFPQGTLVAVQWVLFIGFLITGVFRIVLYCKLPKEIRQTSLLVIGILDTLCSIAMIVFMVQSPLVTSVTFQTTIGYLIGFYAMFAGIDTLCSCGVVRTLGGSVGWTVFAGILYVIAGMVMLSMPVWSVLWLELCVAIYLIVEGVTVCINMISLPGKVNKVRKEVERLGTQSDKPIEIL